MKWSHVAAGVVGLLLGGLWYAAGGTRPPAAADPLRVSESVSHDNLTVFLVRGPDTVDDSRVVTLQEALDRKWAVVHETGSVNQLAVENLSADHELFVQSGDIIKGGRQDRMIATDLLVPPGAGRVPVAAHCVEQSRWAGRAGEADGYFAKSDSFAVGKEIKAANATFNQGEVWANVKAQQDKLSATVGVQVNAVASPTSLQLALENPAVRAQAEAYRAALASAGGRAGVVGAVFVVNGKVTGAEVYGSNGLFRKAWPKLLKSAAEEALAEKATSRPAAPPTAHEIERFLVSAGKGDTTGDRPGLPDAVVTADPIGVPSAATDDAEALQNVGMSGARRSRLLREGGGNPVYLPSPVLGLPEPVVNQTGGAAFGLTNQTEGRPLGTQTEGQLPEVITPIRSALPNLPPTANPSGPTADVIREVADLLEPAPRPAAPANPAGNRLNTNRVEGRATLLVESRDPTRGTVVHRSYIKK